MGILQRTERSIVRTICGMQLKDRKRSTYLMFKLSLNETMDQLVMANSVHWYGNMLRRGWSCLVLIMSWPLKFKVSG